MTSLADATQGGGNQGSFLQAPGVEDIFIACIDSLTGFKEAIHAVFPATEP